MSRSDPKINKILWDTRRVFRLCHFIWLKKWARKHQSGISEDFPFMLSVMTNSTGFITQLLGTFAQNLGSTSLVCLCGTEWSELWVVISDIIPSRILHPFGSLCTFSSISKAEVAPAQSLLTAASCPVLLYTSWEAWCHLLCHHRQLQGLVIKSHFCLKIKPHMVQWYCASFCL